jgi:hypothetical protein
MMDFIDPSAPKTKDEIQRVRSENQKERITPYRPSIDPQLAKLFETSIPNRNEGSSASIVDWSFLDADNGQPGAPADWVKKNIQRLEHWGEDDETHQKMIADMRERYRWTRNIPPPSTPKQYDPNEPSFTPPTEFFGEVDDIDEDDL